VVEAPKNWEKTAGFAGPDCWTPTWAKTASKKSVIPNIVLIVAGWSLLNQEGSLLNQEGSLLNQEGEF